MVFSSTTFIYYFLPSVLAGYYLLSFINVPILQRIWLVGASLFFYGFWKPIYLPLILVSIFVNYTVAELILSRQQTRGTAKGWSEKIQPGHFLLLGILFNVGLLGFFKYFDFFIANFSLLAGIRDPLQLNLILPLGISFFTFQQIAYLVDCRKKLIRKHNIKNYFLFVTFFPQLIAGPIVHHSEMMPQFEDVFKLRDNAKNISKGILIFSIGLFKKIVLADNFGQWADIGFSNPDQLTLLDAWSTCLSYSFQIYFDFSGYTDMAIGLALFFGIMLPLNFNSPYKAVNIQDFWRRWHMTLSRWLRDYIYIPMGGNRVSTAPNYLNLLAVFIIAGLWHGAGWTFILWGALHGVATVIHRIWRTTQIEVSEILARILTFMFVNITWVFFRAEDLHTAKTIIYKMFDIKNSGITKTLTNTLYTLTEWDIFKYKTVPDENMNVLGEPTSIFFYLLMALIIVNIFKNSVERTKELEQGGILVAGRLAIFSVSLFLISISFLYLVPESKFLYFNF